MYTSFSSIAFRPFGAWGSLLEKKRPLPHKTAGVDKSFAPTTSAGRFRD